MSKLEKYTSYKDSGVEWLGEIPEHWGIKKLKHALKFTTGGTPSSGVEDYYNGEEPWVTIADMTGRYIEKSHFISKKAIRECNMQIVPKDSLLYSFKLSVGQVAFTTQNTYTNEAIASFYPANNIDLNFWYYVLPVYVIRNANKNIYGAYLLNQDLIKNATIIFPPKEEQTKIASFLDEKTAQIDNAISQKEKLIELLKEQKQITINEAVIKGLDKDVEFRDSGVEWIGKIPKHWNINRLKFLFKIRKRIANSLGYDVLSITQKGIKVKDIDSGEGQLAMDYSKYQLAFKGDFAMNHMDLLTGYIDISKFDGVISPDYRVFTLEDRNSIPEYYLRLFQMCYHEKIFYAFGQGVSQLGRWRFPADNFNNFFAPIPPKHEQIKIVEYIKTETAKIDKAIELQQNYIAKLKEYKASLIEATVTGKVRVA